MKQILLLLVLVYTTVSTGTAQDIAGKLDELVSAYAKAHKYNGVVLVAKGGKVLINKGYGYRNVADSVPNTAESVFQIGSITKQFTAAIILKLQEEKKLNISDKVSKYFPAYPKGDSITIEHLLTHTSGVFNYTTDAAFMNNEVTKPHNREQMMGLFKDKPLDFSPGSNWNYSNSGYSLLGYIIEAASGMPYEAAVRKYIFTPLRMTHSGFDFAHLKNANKTIGYFVVDGQRALVAPMVDSSVSYAAGSIYTTTADLYLWHQALQQNKILSKAQQEQAYTPVQHKYGYGWNIDSISGKRRVSHNGGIHGFLTNESRVPEDDIDIVLLSNATDRSLEKITQSIYAVLYGTPYDVPKEKVVTQLPAEMLQQYVGEYEILPSLHVVISVKEGQLSALPTNQSEKMLYADKEDSFFQKDDDVQVVFTRDANKQVTGFDFYQNGRQMKCKRLK